MTNRRLTDERLSNLRAMYADATGCGIPGSATRGLVDTVNELLTHIDVLREDLRIARERGDAEGAYAEELKRELDIAKYQAWDTAIKCASNAVNCFPKDTKESLHKFGAETVLRALIHVRKQSLVGLELSEMTAEA